MALRSVLSATKTGRYASVGVVALLLGACATTDKTAYRDAIGAQTNPTDQAAGLDPVAAAAFWGTRYDREPQNADVAVSFSAALRKIGSRAEALKVISKTADANPENPDVLFEFGKTLIEDNRAFEAVRHLEYAQKFRPDDWRVLSAFGVALDQIGEHEAAREKYNLALAYSPDAVSVMNNKGLSYALSGDLDLAQNVLMQASGSHRANARVRQNLALVSALKGDIAQAERLARSDLPPQVAENNISYFRSLLSQPAYWQDFAASEVDVPSFDEPAFESLPSEPVETDVLEDLKEAPVVPLPPAPVEPEVEEEDEEDLTAPLVLGPVTSPTAASFEDDDADDVEDDS